VPAEDPSAAFQAADGGHGTRPSRQSPAVQSLRDLQRACALDKVRKRLGVTRASLGSMSESVAIFDPAPLKEIAAELGHTIRSRPKQLLGCRHLFSCDHNGVEIQA